MEFHALAVGVFYHKGQRIKAGVLSLLSGEDMGPGVQLGGVQSVAKGTHMDKQGIDPLFPGRVRDLFKILLKGRLGMLRRGEGHIRDPNAGKHGLFPGLLRRQIQNAFRRCGSGGRYRG